MALRSTFDLTGRVALVTGASSRGIGSGAAEALAAAGAKVFLVARREENLKERVAEIGASGGVASYAVCDATDEEQCKAAVEKCVEEFGRLDIMVLSAGISGMFSEDLEDFFETDDWEEVLGTNLWGVVYFIKHGYEECARNGVGSIIPISSMAALKVDGMPAYTATKGALLRLVPYFAKHMGPLGIRVNAIAPGLINTDMTNPPGWHTEDMLFVPAAEKAPLRRCATIEDCANAILFLASDGARNITGQTIAVDGGESLI